MSTTTGTGAKDADAGGLSLNEDSTSRTYAAPSMLVRHEATTANVANLPRSGDLVDVAAGLDARDACTTPRLESTEDVAPVATG